MKWQGHTTEGWAKLLQAVAALEKRYGVSISWKEKFGALRLRPQVGFSAERAIPLAEFYASDSVSTTSAASALPPNSPLSEEDEADLRALCAAIEAASISTCQVCGVRGEVRQHRIPDDRRVMNLCTECAQSRMNVIAQCRKMSGHPRAPCMGMLLNDACRQHNQALQGLLPFWAEEEAQSTTQGRTLENLPMPFFDKSASWMEDADACEHLVQQYVTWLEAVAGSLRNLYTR